MARNPHYEADPKVIEKKVNGLEEITVKPRGLNIVWGNDDRYWAVPDSKTNDNPAELLQVCWLEVTGSVDAHPEKSYEVCFRLSLTPDAFGWGGSPTYIMAKKGKNGKFAWTKHFLTDSSGDKFDKCLTIGLNRDSTDGKLYFGLYEVWSGKWKGGLRIHEVIIREVRN